MIESRIRDRPATFPEPDIDLLVTIGQAKELSGLSIDAIRYFETQPGVNVGKRRGKGKHRLYSAHDIQLLRWYRESNLGAAEAAAILQKDQEEILTGLGYPTVAQVVSNARNSVAQSALLYRLSTLLVSTIEDPWHTERGEASSQLQGVILGPQDREWAESFRRDCDEKRASNLANCLLIWRCDSQTEEALARVDVDTETPPNWQVFFSSSKWFLSYSDCFRYDMSRFETRGAPPPMALLHRSADSPAGQAGQPSRDAQHYNWSRKAIQNLILECLGRLMESSRTARLSLSACHEDMSSPEDLAQAMNLLLQTCIDHHFPGCYYYIARLDETGQPEVLADNEDVRNQSYLEQTGRVPWWVRFAWKRAQVALARDVTQYTYNTTERGSVVCVPLTRFGKTVGVLCVENADATDSSHCLVQQHGIAGEDWLRYLFCIAEIAAHWLAVSGSSLQGSERTIAALTQGETIGWYWDTYRFGGHDYTRAIEKIADWMSEVGIEPNDRTDVVLVDVAEEGSLVEQMQGFTIVVDLLDRTIERIQQLMQHGRHAESLVSDFHLRLFEPPIGDHLLLAAANAPRDYLLQFCQDIAELWKVVPFEWRGQHVPVVLQTGVCRFTNLTAGQRNWVVPSMNFHLQKLAIKMFDKGRLERPMEYTASVKTDQVDIDPWTNSVA